MQLGLNWVDLVIIITLVLFALEGLGKPLLSELLDLASFLLAAIISFRYYNLAGKLFETQFQIPHGLSLVLGFMLVWFLAETIFYLIVRFVWQKLPKKGIWRSRVLSIVPSVSRGLILIALFLVIIATFPIQPVLKKAVLDSRIGSRILANAYALETPIKNVFGGVTNESLTFLTIKPRTTETVKIGFQTTAVSEDPATEEAMVELVNREREKVGKSRLVFDVSLRAVARAHSRDMFARGYFSHYSPEGDSVADRAASAGIDFLVIGENLAYAPNLELAHQGLMNSEGHQANILSDDYGKVGIGVIDGGIYGKMFTQVFSK